MMLMWVVIPMIEDGTGGGYDECAANTKIDINHNLLRVEHIIKYIKIYIYTYVLCPHQAQVRSSNLHPDVLQGEGCNDTKRKLEQDPIVGSSLASVN